jgi:hypothetical protein
VAFSQNPGRYLEENGSLFTPRIHVSFKSGNSTFSGAVKGDRIELERASEFGFNLPRPPQGPTELRPAIGPPPDGSDPSPGTSLIPASIPVIFTACLKLTDYECIRTQTGSLKIAAARVAA